MRRAHATTAALTHRKISPSNRGINPPLVYPRRGTDPARAKKGKPLEKSLSEIE